MGFKCPLCKQKVSKNLYDKITGVWKEKERRLADLKMKEKQLIEKERKFKADAKKQRLNQKKIFQEKLQKQKDALKSKEALIQKQYEKKLKREVNREMAKEKLKMRALKAEMKQKFEKDSQKKLARGMKKIEKDKKDLEKREKTQANRYKQLHKQYASYQNKSMTELEKRNKKIKSLEEQLQKGQTPQMLGLLDEGIFLSKLKEEFPNDKYEHTGKGGDIVHHIIDKDKEIGIIVYELKKVSTFSKSHIAQALEAKQQRQADYGILVTNAKRKKDISGFFISKGVIIIHPAGAMVLVSILREHIIKISKLKLSKAQREKTINEVLEYIQSPSFKNGIETIIINTLDLYNGLKKEVKDHISMWKIRLAKYKSTHTSAYRIETKVVKLFLEEKKGHKIILEGEIEPIALPEKID